MGKKAVLTEDDLYDDDLDSDFDDEEDEFDALLREAEDLLDEEPVAREVPHCETVGQHELDGTSKCIHCGLAIEAEPEPVKKRGKRNPGEPRLPMMSGHCAHPQSANPEESHERCALLGAGNRAVPDKVFAPCPDLCHLDETEYECDLCGGIIRAAPYWTGEFIDPEDTDMVTFVHVVDGRGQEECP